MVSLFGRSKTSNGAARSIRLYEEDEALLADLSIKLGIAEASTIHRVALRVLHEVTHCPRLFDLFWKLNTVGVLQPARQPLIVIQKQPNLLKDQQP